MRRPAYASRPMNALGLIRGAVVAAVVYGIVIVVTSLAGAPFDPLDEGGNDALYVVVVVGALLASAAGTVAGAWQARAGGVGVALLAVLVAALTVVVVGVLLSAANQGTNDTGELLRLVAHPVGAAAGAALWIVRFTRAA